MKIFIPLCEEFDTGIVRGPVMDELGLAPGDLVPFQLHYECLRVGEAFPEAVRPFGGSGRRDLPAVAPAQQRR